MDKNELHQFVLDSSAKEIRDLAHCFIDLMNQSQIKKVGDQFGYKPILNYTFNESKLVDPGNDSEDDISADEEAEVLRVMEEEDDEDAFEVPKE